MRLSACPLCERKRVFVRLAHNEIAVRCTGCGASAVTLSMVAVLRKLAPQLHRLGVYELSARGALFAFLQQHAQQLTGSEYFPALASGQYHNGVLCEDVQALSFSDASFDLCTSTDVFEHVADDGLGFRNVLRVLKPQGLFVFTVPLCAAPATIERAVRNADGSIKHLLSPEYHGDPIGKTAHILAFRNYGGDIVARLIAAGFASAEIVWPQFSIWNFTRPVVVAYKHNQQHSAEV